MNSVDASGVVSATYGYSWTFSNSSGSTESGSQSGSYTFSSTDYSYINGTDDQTGYVNPTVWFLMDNSIPKGGHLHQSEHADDRRIHELQLLPSIAEQKR